MQLAKPFANSGRATQVRLFTGAGCQAHGFACITQGMDVLRHMKSLKIIVLSLDAKDQLTAVEFWKRYDAGEFK